MMSNVDDDYVDVDDEEAYTEVFIHRFIPELTRRGQLIEAGSLRTTH